jgi:hypothetical protein
MPRVQDVQDLIDHTVATEGVHKMTKTPTPGGVPVAYFDGKIDDKWLSDNILKVGDKGEKITAEDLPDNVIWLVSGKIPAKYLPSTIKATAFQSGGSKTATNYFLADGTDLALLISSSIGEGDPLAIVTHTQAGLVSQVYRNPPLWDVKLEIIDGVLTLKQKQGNQIMNCNCCDSC